jgi:hypothetical protein
MSNPSLTHAGRRYPTSAEVKGRQGRFLVIKKGDLRTRVGLMAVDGTVEGESFLVATAEVFDEQPVFENSKRRFMSTHAGRTFPTTAAVLCHEVETPRKYVVQRGSVETRLIEIGPDQMSIGESYVIPTSQVVDIRNAPVCLEITVDERGAMVIPAALRDRLQMTRPWIVQVKEIDDGFIVRPLRPRT